MWCCSEHAGAVPGLSWSGCWFAIAVAVDQLDLCVAEVAVEVNGRSSVDGGTVMLGESMTFAFDDFSCIFAVISRPSSHVRWLILVMITLRDVVVFHFVRLLRWAGLTLFLLRLAKEGVERFLHVRDGAFHWFLTIGEAPSTGVVFIVFAAVTSSGMVRGGRS